MRRRIPWFEILLTIVFLSATVYAAFSDGYNLPNRWFIRDDAYYYFKVAQNISEGHGSTFDGLHATNGYHPLWLLICIPVFALARFDLILPLRVLALIIGLLQVGAAILLYRLVRDAVSTAAGVLAACFWAFNSHILVFLYKTGVESNIALLLLLLLLTLLFRFERTWRQASGKPSQIAGFGILAALVTFGRLDLVFFALSVGIWIVFRRSALRYLLSLDILGLVVASVSAYLARLGFTAYYAVSSSAAIVLVISLAVKIPILYGLGLYTPPAQWKPVSLTGRLLLATVLGTLILAVVLWAGQALGMLPPFSRAILLLDAGLSFAAVFLIRFFAYTFRLKSTQERDVRPLSELRSQWPGWLRDGLRYYGILAGALAAYMLWNQLTFGTPTPVSGQIKQWWGSFTHSIYGSAAANWLTFFALNPFSDFNAWAPPTTVLSDLSNRVLYAEGTGFGNPRWRASFAVVLVIASVAACLILALRRRQTVRAAVQTGMIPLFVGSWLQILAYNIPGYASPKEWYWLTEPVLLVILGALLLNAIFEVGIRKWKMTRVVLWILVSWFAASGAYTYWRDAYFLSPYGLHPRDTPYTDVIPFLESHTEAGAIIGMTGGGNVGYLMPGRTIVNMDGLINSRSYFLALQAGTGADYLYETGMRYVFANPNLLDANPYRGQFSTRLQPVVDWGGKDLLRLLPHSGQ